MSIHYKLGRLVKLIEEESNLFDEVLKEAEETISQTMRNFTGKKVEYEQFKKSHTLILSDNLPDYLGFRIKETQGELDQLLHFRSVINKALEELKEGRTVEIERVAPSKTAES